jgi:UDP-3-O-[3-hydroxymyristoyl] N-acetylglucosamine deacetylase
MGDTILVVDDEQQIRQTVRGVLADEGYDVIEADNGRRALDVLAERPPQLALVDIWMPEVDGIELVQRMRHEAPGLPIIVMSGHGTIETAVQVIRMGAADFLEKPFKLDALLAAVTRVLRERDSVAPAHEPAPAGSTSPVGTTPRVVAQQTIGRSVVVNGQGLHSGVRTGLILEPLPPSSGIVFEDITTRERVAGLIDFVDSTGYATTLVAGGMAAKTVEHLMAALHAYGVTNLLVKMFGEVPILDGSAQDLCALVADAGVVEQDAVIEPIVIDRVYQADIGDPAKKSLHIEPADTFEVRYELEYPAPIGRQEYDFTLTDPDAFAREIAPARTFGFVKEIEFLEQMGLASGGRLNNFILVGDEGVVNAPLRFEDEFVRHKILDIVGDFYLLGRPVRGRVVARRTGHGDNAVLLRVLRERFGLPPLRPVESLRAS